MDLTFKKVIFVIRNNLFILKIGVKINVVELWILCSFDA